MEAAPLSFTPLYCCYQLLLIQVWGGDTTSTFLLKGGFSCHCSFVLSQALPLMHLETITIVAEAIEMKLTQIGLYKICKTNHVSS